MTSLLSFRGRTSRLPYAVCSAVVFFSQHLVVWLTFRLQHIPMKVDWPFWVLPLRSLERLDGLSDLVLLSALACGLVVSWMLAALAFRRAADADVSEWTSAAALVPVIQIPVIAYLCVARPRPLTTSDAPDGRDVGWSAVVGVIAGVGATVLAVAVGTLVFGEYGYGLFVVSPFVIGAITAYLANRTGDIGQGPTAWAVTAATALGAAGLVVTAIEGILCIILASPLGLGAALIGGLLGRSIASSGRRPANHVAYGFALLPIAFALESALPKTSTFDTLQTIVVDAPVDVVWKSIVDMDTMDEPLALPFRLGVAYPVRGEILGEGIGAVRRGEFSTGVAIERVTEWVPNRKLAFVVEKDVPAMRELSPYRHVRAPHAIGYFSTGTTSFELQKRPDGKTEVVERTSHRLRLDPLFYWLPMARWIVQENNARMLSHVRHQAERSIE